MKRKPPSRQTKAEKLLQDPAIQRALELNKLTECMADVLAIKKLALMLLERPRGTDYLTLARRYLRRARGGQWCYGSSHVARPEFGPGLGFPEPREGGEQNIVMINFPPAAMGGKELLVSPRLIQMSGLKPQEPHTPADFMIRHPQSNHCLVRFREGYAWTWVWQTCTWKAARPTSDLEIELNFPNAWTPFQAAGYEGGVPFGS